MHYLLALLFSASLLCYVSSQVNDADAKNIRQLERPFRMAKINLIWEKALRNDLTNTKLEVLLSELKVQDKQEMTLKKLKSEGGDKEGLMEDQLRKSLSGIMERFGLGNTNTSDGGGHKEPMQALFKDKKLNKLWQKAEISGFTQEELKTLKEEFDHHQEKIDQFYELLNDANKVASNDILTNDDKFNNFGGLEENELHPEMKSINAIREKHRTLKQGLDQLHRKATSGPNSKEFIEPKVAGLWRLATNSDFTPEELESLHTELKHYESRLLKVRHLTAEMLQLAKNGGSDSDHPDPEVRLAQKLEEVSDSEGERLLKERIVKQRRTVDKLHDHLENRILQRHSEL